MKAADFYTKLAESFEKGLPFVVYREPQVGTTIPVKALVQDHKELCILSDYKESGFVFAPFELEEGVVLIPEQASEKYTLAAQPEESIRFSEGLNYKEEAPQEAASSMGKQQHLDLVQKAVDSLKNAEMEKVVLSRKEEVTIGGKHPLDLFQELLLAYPTAFVYCWSHPQVGLWLGATPETLLRTEGTRFKTMALAGTQKYTGTMDVTWGEKEIQEQQYVTDSILEDLKSQDLDSRISISEAYTTKAGNLLHLRTDISGWLNSSENLEQIIRSLHPTPAVCGLPKEKARQYILDQEAYDREFYTGFLGELNLQEKQSRSRSRRNVENLAYMAVKRKTSLFVNLRCMKLENEKAHLYVGGGITKDSVPEDEWQETQNKAQTMKKVLLKV